MEFDLNQVWSVLYEIGKVISILAWKFGSFILWAYSQIASYAGEPAAFATMGALLILVPYLVLNKLISATQASLETLQASLAGKAIMAIGVWVLMFAILYILASL